MKPRLLANENFPAPSIRHLREIGFDVVSIAEGDLSLDDTSVLARAVSERRWIVTFDRDYGQLIFGRGLASPPAVVLFRMRSYRPDTPGRMPASLFASPVNLEGQFVLIDDAGTRKRPLPKSTSTG